MIRFLFRFVGLWILAGGFVALVLDGVRSIASSEIVTTPLGVTWLATSPDSLARFQGFVETSVSPPCGRPPPCRCSTRRSSSCSASSASCSC